MKIKLPKQSKDERILAILNYWDPCHKASTAGILFYNYEAEELGQSVRKNSKLETVEKKLRETMEFKLDTEGSGADSIDDETWHQVAAAILHTVKNS